MPFSSCVRGKTATLLPQDDGGDGLGSLGEIALSENGSVVLAGVNDGDFAAVKLDANGNKTWVRQVRRHVEFPKLAG